MENNKTTKTALGLDENITGALCYVFGFITGIIFLVLEKENKFVRFHAIQSLVTSLSLYIISVIVGIIPIIGLMLSFLIAPLVLILWLLLMYKAYKGERFKLPIVGDFAEKQIGK